MAAKTEKPALYAALTAQTKQAFFELITHDDPDTIVCIEKHDDVSVRNDNSIEFIQVKSVTSSGNNPLSNGSAELWKALANWVSKLESGEYAEFKVMFRYSVCTAHKINSGTVVRSFANAYGCYEAEEAYKHARDVIEKLTESRHKSVFFAEEHHDFAIEVIRGFSYELHPNFEQETRNRFFNIGSFQIEWRQDMFQGMVGWIADKSASRVEAGKPVQIRREEFHRELIAKAGRFRANPLSETAAQPEKPEIEREIAGNPNYLKQLELIDLRESEGPEAVIARLRSHVQMEKWAETMQITNEEVVAYQDSLIGTWQDVGGLMSVEDETDDRRKLGQRIFYRTRHKSRTIPIRNSQLPNYLGPGQLHELANGLRIGWHPDFRRVLIDGGDVDASDTIE